MGCIWFVEVRGVEVLQVQVVYRYSFSPTVVAFIAFMVYYFLK